jgi:hypothetical protein
MTDLERCDRELTRCIEALDRCDREIAEIMTRPDILKCPAWLIALGVNDWEYEKKLIEAEQFVETYAELKAPFPWFGGKSKVAHLVWDRFGNVDNYVEPFAGSLAVLLARPHAAQTETVNDMDCYLANFWRALSLDPYGLCEHADWPVNEADLHARHVWLVNQDEFRERMKTDPEFYDVRVAGWWVWGISQWIGSGWCSRPEWMGTTNAARTPRGIQTWQQVPDMGTNGKGVHRKRPMVHGGHTGKGIHQDLNLRHMDGTILSSAGEGIHRKLPSLGDSGRGVARQLPSHGDSGRGVARQLPMLSGNQGINREGVTYKRPMLSGHGSGVGVHSERSSALLEYFEALAARLRRVRVCCGDWKRVTGPSVTVKHGVCGIFLDPPYDMRVVSDASSGRDGAAPSDGLYANHDNDLSREVRSWAIENGANPLLRIALCGYEGEHAMPDSWACVPWKSRGGYGSQRRGGANDNAARERIWFSPYCIEEGPLFRDTLP